MELMEFERRVNLIKETHNEIREQLYKEFDDRAYYFNESTILRLAALLEHPDFGNKLKPQGTKIKDQNNGEPIVRTLFYFRDLILHNDGKFKMFSEATEAGKEVPAVKKFLKRFKEYKLKEGERLVIFEQPMVSCFSFSLKKWFLSKANKEGLTISVSRDDI